MTWDNTPPATKTVPGAAFDNGAPGAKSVAAASFANDAPAEKSLAAATFANDAPSEKALAAAAFDNGAPTTKFLSSESFTEIVDLSEFGTNALLGAVLEERVTTTGTLVSTKSIDANTAIDPDREFDVQVDEVWASVPAALADRVYLLLTPAGHRYHCLATALPVENDDTLSLVVTAHIPGEQALAAASFTGGSPANKALAATAFANDAPAEKAAPGGSFANDAPAEKSVPAATFANDAPAEKALAGTTHDNTAPGAQASVGASWSNDPPASVDLGAAAPPAGENVPTITLTETDPAHAHVCGEYVRGSPLNGSPAYYLGSSWVIAKPGSVYGIYSQTSIVTDADAEIYYLGPAGQGPVTDGLLGAPYPTVSYAA